MGGKRVKATILRRVQCGFLFVFVLKKKLAQSARKVTRLAGTHFYHRKRSSQANVFQIKNLAHPVCLTRSRQERERCWHKQRGQHFSHINGPKVDPAGRVTLFPFSSHERSFGPLLCFLVEKFLFVFLETWYSNETVIHDCSTSFGGLSNT